MKFKFSLIPLTLFLSFCSSIPRLETKLPYYQPFELSAPEIASYKEVGRIVGSACRKKGGFIFPETPGPSFEMTNFQNFKNGLSSEEDNELILAAYADALSKNTNVDVVVNSRYTRIPSSNGECVTYQGEGLEILALEKLGKAVASNKINSKNKKNTRETYEMDGVRYKKYEVIEYPLVFLNVFYTAGLASEDYSPNNKKGICNVPFYGGYFNVATLGTACYLSYRDRKEITTCESPLLGGILNFFTLGGACNRPSSLLSKE